VNPDVQSEHIEKAFPPGGWRRYVRASSIVSTALLLVAVFLIVALSTHLGDTQWDFTTYYYAGKISATGGDVYNVDVSRQIAGGYVHQYLYPPMAARLFRPLASLPMKTARQIWFWLHILALVPLVWIWRRYFIMEGPGWPFYLLAIVGFGESIYLDLKAGNVTIFEQLLLWLGFALLVRKRTALFCLCVVGAALLKGMPLLFLGLLFLLSVDRKWLYAAGSVVLFGLVQIIDYAFDSAAYSGYVTRALVWDERGPEFNPSTLALLKDLKRAVIGPGFSESTADIALWVIYCLLAADAANICKGGWRKLRRVSDHDRRACLDPCFWHRGSSIQDILVHDGASGGVLCDSPIRAIHHRAHGNYPGRSDDPSAFADRTMVGRYFLVVLPDSGADPVLGGLGGRDDQE
jgi:hypothetical protein